MPKVKINDIEHDVAAGMTVLQACQQAGIEVPMFCFHDRLSIAGNCRMCLVEVKPGPPKPQASCSLPIMEGQEIRTDSDMVHKARKGVLEFLLINHPLDCPICDQGGECDLQDQTMAYGPDSSRYHENKRAVKDKYMGPLIKTIMTRCIHCTRCVRFSTEIAGVNTMGLLNRGEHAEISTLEKAVDSELSANVIDLCPVGALTSKPYAFVARPWELRKTETIDVMDAVGCNIRMDSRGNEVLRILPRLHEDINEEWISDKTRYVCDALSRNRLDKVYIRDNNKKLQASDNWQAALYKIADHMKDINANEIAAIAGDYHDCESLFAFKSLADKLKIPHIDCRSDGTIINDKFGRGGYLFNSSIANIEQADYLLIIGANPRYEAPLINARIRKTWLHGHLQIANIGDDFNATYRVQNYGNEPTLLNDILSDNHDIAKALSTAKNPIIILGNTPLTRHDGDSIYQAVMAICEKYNIIRKDWNGFNILHQVASRVGGLDIGFVSQDNTLHVNDYAKALQEGKIKQLWILGADDYIISDNHQQQIVNRPDDSLVIYVGHHGDVGAHIADIILPTAAYSEKDGTYVNVEGRVQLANRAVFPIGNAKEEWAIYRALSAILEKPLSFDDFSELQAKMRKTHPHLAEIDMIAPADINNFNAKNTYEIDNIAFTYPINDFYVNDVLSRASLTMSQCSQEFSQKQILPQSKAS